MQSLGYEFLRGVLAGRLEVDCAGRTRVSCRRTTPSSTESKREGARERERERRRTDKVVAHAPELDLVLELVMPQHLATDGVAARVGDDEAVGGDVDDAGGKAGLELAVEVVRDVGEELDGREEAVRGGRCKRDESGRHVAAACLCSW